MQFAIQVRGNWSTALTAARWAESSGLTALALPDHYLVRGNRAEEDAFDHLVHLAALARETESLRLVCLVAPVGFRHPAVLYKMAVTIDEVSDGRFTLGVGTGWMEDEFVFYGIPYPDQATRYAELEDALRYLTAALTPGAVPYEGEFFRLGDFDPHPHPKDVRLLVGGTGDSRTPWLAGTYADEYNIYLCAPEDFRRKVERARAAAQAEGRDPDNIAISTAGPGLVAPTEAEYRDLLGRYASYMGSSPDRVEEAFTERGYIFGWGEKPAEMVAALEEAGCQRFYVQMFLGDPGDYDPVFAALGHRLVV